MEKLNFNSGIREYELGAGILRFNPSDPNVYARFMDAIPKIEAVENDMIEAGNRLTDAESRLQLMQEADAKVKAQLDGIFPGNDFNQMLEGVSLMAVTDNKERVITSLLDALTPIIENGVNEFTNTAVGKAKRNRAQRRASQKGLE